MSTATSQPTGNAKHQAAVAAKAAHLDQLRADVRTQLAALVEIDGRLADLADTHQSVGLGFMTEEARQARASQDAADRAAARGHTNRITLASLRWLNATSSVAAGGKTEAPATMPALSAAADIVFLLQSWIRVIARSTSDQVAQIIADDYAQHADWHRARTAWERQTGLRTAMRRAAAAGFCLWPDPTPTLVPHPVSPTGRHPLAVNPPTSDPDAGVPRLAATLGHLVDLYDRAPALESLIRDLEQVEKNASDVVHGPAQTNHPGLCPWCGRQSLVIHHRTKGRDTSFIRCEGRHRCECDWEWCDCHRNPTRNRHEWVNSGRASHTWNELHNLQTKRKELALMETKALDAVTRARGLHEPHRYDDQGNEIACFVHVTDDQVPVGHVCEVVIDSDIADDDPRLLAVNCQRVTDPQGATHIWHGIPVCASCGDGGASGDPANAVTWPCPTLRALELDQPTDTTTGADSPNHP